MPREVVNIVRLLQMFPQNWGAKAQDNGWFLANFISSRANLTHAIAGKPIVLEEAGVQDDWGARDQVLVETLPLGLVAISPRHCPC